MGKKAVSLGQKIGFFCPRYVNIFLQYLLIRNTRYSKTLYTYKDIYFKFSIIIIISYLWSIKTFYNTFQYKPIIIFLVSVIIIIIIVYVNNTIYIYNIKKVFKVAKMYFLVLRLTYIFIFC